MTKEAAEALIGTTVYVLHADFTITSHFVSGIKRPQNPRLANVWYPVAGLQSLGTAPVFVTRLNALRYAAEACESSIRFYEHEVAEITQKIEHEKNVKAALLAEIAAAEVPA